MSDRIVELLIRGTINVSPRAGLIRILSLNPKLSYNATHALLTSAIPSQYRAAADTQSIHSLQSSLAIYLSLDQSLITLSLSMFRMSAEGGAILRSRLRRCGDASPLMV